MERAQRQERDQWEAWAQASADECLDRSGGGNPRRPQEIDALRISHLAVDVSCASAAPLTRILGATGAAAAAAGTGADITLGDGRVASADGSGMGAATEASGVDIDAHTSHSIYPSVIMALGFAVSNAAAQPGATATTCGGTLAPELASTTPATVRCKFCGMNTLVNGSEWHMAACARRLRERLRAGKCIEGSTEASLSAVAALKVEKQKRQDEERDAAEAVAAANGAARARTVAPRVARLSA